MLPNDAKFFLSRIVGGVARPHSGHHRWVVFGILVGPPEGIDTTFLVCWLACPKALTQPLFVQPVGPPEGVAWVGIFWYVGWPALGMAQRFWFDQGRGVQQTQGLLLSPASARRLRKRPATALVAGLT